MHRARTVAEATKACGASLRCMDHGKAVAQIVPANVAAQSFVDTQRLTRRLQAVVVHVVAHNRLSPIELEAIAPAWKQRRVRSQC